MSPRPSQPFRHQVGECFGLGLRIVADLDPGAGPGELGLDPVEPGGELGEGGRVSGPGLDGLEPLEQRWIGS